MKFLLALAAFLLAATSLAAAGTSACADQQHAATHSIASDDCHDGALMAVGGDHVGCAFTAHCAMLCGVAPPSGPELVRADFRAIEFVSALDFPHAIHPSPEAPPPRAALL